MQCDVYFVLNFDINTHTYKSAFEEKNILLKNTPQGVNHLWNFSHSNERGNCKMEITFIKNSCYSTRANNDLKLG